MKNIRTIISAMSMMAMTFNSAYADNRFDYYNKEGIKEVQVFVEDNNGISIEPLSDGMFVIEGMVADGVEATGYNIYLTDSNTGVTDEDLVATVPVNKKRFRFEKKLNTLKSGRIRAVLPNGKLGKSWINIYFIPGFRVFMKVNDGSYDLINRPDYEFMMTAWMNRESLLTMLGAEASMAKNRTDELRKLEKVLGAYQQLLENMQQQVPEITHSYLNLNARETRLNQLYKQMDEVNAKMQEAIEKYASSIDL